MLDGKLTIEVEGTAFVLGAGDLISCSSRRPHRIWNRGTQTVRTLWINLERN